MRAKALIDAISVIDEQGIHTWTVGKEYTITETDAGFSVSSDEGEISITYSEYWIWWLKGLFDLDIKPHTDYSDLANKYKKMRGNTNASV